MVEDVMDQCTCNQAIPREEIGMLAHISPGGKLTSYRFDVKCPVHRVISAVNGVPLETRKIVEEKVDKPLTAREKRQKAFKERAKKPKA